MAGDGQVNNQTRLYKIGGAIAMMIFGISMLIGACYFWRSGQWPWFLDPRLNLFAWVFDLFGKTAAFYLKVIFLSTLGFGITLVCGVWLFKPSKS